MAVVVQNYIPSNGGKIGEYGLKITRKEGAVTY
jgi:hypothetical protein